jgi:hypothetical protein
MLISVKPKGGNTVTVSIKAQVATILVGNVSIEGVIGEDGQEYVSAPQVCALLSISGKQASRDIKALMPESFEFIKATVFRGKKRANSKDVNIMSIESFVILLAALDRRGNVQAQILSDRSRFSRDIFLPIREGKKISSSRGLYVLGNKDMGFCKIGIACDIQRRMKEIQTGCPYPLVLWFFKPMQGAAIIEKKLHRQFSDYRLNGEWFSSDVFSLVDWASLQYSARRSRRSA